MPAQKNTTSSCWKTPRIRTCAYSGAPKPSMLALDIEQLRTASNKASRVDLLRDILKDHHSGLAGGLVVIASTPVIQKMGLLKQASDFHTAALTQMVLTEVAASLPQSHIAMLCETYGARLNAMREALSAHMPKGVTWTEPEGGMFVFVTLPPGIDTAELLKEAIAAGIAFVPGESFFPDNKLRNTMRLSFTSCEPPIIQERHCPARCADRCKNS